MSGEQNGGLDLSALIGKLTENPALLSGLISTLAPKTQETPSSSDTPTGNAPAIDPEMISKLLPVVSMLGSGGTATSPPSPKASSNPRCELLRALRPFLSPSRCEAVDYMIKMDGLSGMLKGIKNK